MDLTVDEQKLLADFRRLSPTGRTELLEYAITVIRSSIAAAEEPDTTPAPLEPSPEADPR